MSLPHLLSSCLLAVLAATSVPALAAPPSARRPPSAGVPVAMPWRSNNDDALSDSVRRVERSTRGQVLSAERVPFDGRDVNRIKTVDEHGRVRVFMDDPRSRRPAEPESPTRGNDD